MFKFFTTLLLVLSSTVLNAQENSNVFKNKSWVLYQKDALDKWVSDEIWRFDAASLIINNLQTSKEQTVTQKFIAEANKEYIIAGKQKLQFHIKDNSTIYLGIGTTLKYVLKVVEPMFDATSIANRDFIYQQKTSSYTLPKTTLVSFKGDNTTTIDRVTKSYNTGMAFSPTYKINQVESSIIFTNQGSDEVTYKFSTQNGALILSRDGFTSKPQNWLENYTLYPAITVSDADQFIFKPKSASDLENESLSNELKKNFSGKKFYIMETKFENKFNQTIQFLENGTYTRTEDTKIINGTWESDKKFLSLTEAGSTTKYNVKSKSATDFYDLSLSATKSLFLENFKELPIQLAGTYIVFDKTNKNIGTMNFNNGTVEMELKKQKSTASFELSKLKGEYVYLTKKGGVTSKQKIEQIDSNTYHIKSNTALIYSLKK